MEEITSFPAGNGNRSAVTQASEQILASDLIIKIRYATALGWAMTELLGRCIALISWLKANPPHSSNFKLNPVVLSPIRDPRERALTVMGRILFLANQLGVAECRIEQNNNNENVSSEFGRYYSNEANEKVRAFSDDFYVKVLEKKVRALCTFTHDDETNKQIRADINCLLLNWGEEIQYLLQTHPPAVYNAYTVARGFATIRWWIGVGEKDPAMDQANSNEEGTWTIISKGRIWLIEHFPNLRLPNEGYNGQNGLSSNALLGEATLDKLLDHLQSISSYLPPLVPQALEYSLVRWGKTILMYPGVWRELAALQDSKIHSNEDSKKNDAQSSQSGSWNKQKNIKLNMKRALIKQAIIWHDLLTDERDPTTFIQPSAINRRYFWKILRHSIPYFLVGLFVAVGVAFLITYLQRLLSMPVTGTQNATTQSITDTIIITIVSLVSAIPFARTIWIWGSKTTTDFIGKYENVMVSRISTAEKDALKLLWQRAQQEAVNAKTFVRPHSRPPDVDDGD